MVLDGTRLISLAPGCAPNASDHVARLDQRLSQLLSRYERDPRPIPINVRHLVPVLKSAERYTHLLHPYPAKLIHHIPYLFLQSTLFSCQGDRALDPFAGSGTVGLEAILAQRDVVLVDANPLAALIASVKT